MGTQTKYLVRNRGNYVNSCLLDFYRLKEIGSRSGPINRLTTDHEQRIEKIEKYSCHRLRAECCECVSIQINKFICYFLQHFCVYALRSRIKANTTCNFMFQTFHVRIDRYVCTAFAAGFVIACAQCSHCFYAIGSERVKKKEKRSRSKTEEYHNYDGISLLLGEYFNCIAKMHGHSNNNNKCNAIKANQCESAPAFDRRIHKGFVSFYKFLPCIFISGADVRV